MAGCLFLEPHLVRHIHLRILLNCGEKNSLNASPRFSVHHLWFDVLSELLDAVGVPIEDTRTHNWTGLYNPLLNHNHKVFYGVHSWVA